jgi:putative DNA methylase
MAIVAQGARGRVYLTPTKEQVEIAKQARPEWQPDVAMPENPRWFSPPLYGLKTYGDLFTPRQLVALTTFSNSGVRKPVERFVVRMQFGHAGFSDDSIGCLLDAGGDGATAYAQAVGVYLAFAVSRKLVIPVNVH